MFLRVLFRSLTTIFVVFPLMTASASEKAKESSGDSPPVVPAKIEDAHVVSAWTRAAETGENTHVFLVVENKGPVPIFLKGGETDVASAVQLVRFEMLGAFMRTTLVDPVLVDPNGRYSFEPGVVAVELRNLKKSLHKGERLPMKFVFADLGEVAFNVEVDGRTAIRYDEPPPDAIPAPGAKKSGH